MVLADAPEPILISPVSVSAPILIAFVPAASIVAEGMLSFALADALLDKFGGDSMKQFKAHLDLSGKY